MITMDKNIINATKWATISELLVKLVMPITNMVLARIIAPEAFGVVTSMTMIISFADIFTDAGFQKYLIQHEFKDEDEKFKYANVAFWTNFIISIILICIILVFRYKIAILIGSPGLEGAISLSSIQLLLTSFSSIQMALYKREFDFKILFLVRLVSILVPFLVTIPLAFIGFSYWSILIANIIIQFLNSLILTVKSKWKPGLFYDFLFLKNMISFSIWSLIESISIWLTSWVDIFIISSTLNQYYLGVYKTSTTMVNSFMSLITASIIPVFFSALSRLQHNNKEFELMYFNVQKIISILVFPLGVGIYLYSDLATKIMLGGSWSEAESIIGIWALTSSIMIIFGNLNSEVYRAKGNPKLSFIAQLLHLIVLIPVCIISSRYSFQVLVYARAWIRLELILVHFVIIKYIIKFSIKKIFKNVYSSLIATGVMYLFGISIKNLNDTIIWSFTSIILCALIYLLTLTLFNENRIVLKKLFKNLCNIIK